MKPFHEAVSEIQGSWETLPDGCFTVSLPDGNGGVYTVELEPLLFGQYYLAVYHDEELVAAKVPVRPGGYPEN